MVCCTAVSIARFKPPGPMPSGAGIVGCPGGSLAEPSTSAHPKRDAGPQCCTKQLVACEASLALHTTNSFRWRYRAMQAGQSGLRGASGWAVRAAGSKADRNLAPPFLRRKDKGSRPQNNLSSTLHTLIHHTIEEEYICARL